MQEVVSALLDGAQVLHQVLGAHNTAASQQLLQPRASTPTARPQRLPSTEFVIECFFMREYRSTQSNFGLLCWLLAMRWWPGMKSPHMRLELTD